jgi:MarR family transcriptional regulator, temperature-dependent positive regulator of motility
MTENIPLSDMPGHLIRRLNQVSASVFQDRVKAAGYDLTSVQLRR